MGRDDVVVIDLSSLNVSAKYKSHDEGYRYEKDGTKGTKYGPNDITYSKTSVRAFCDLICTEIDHCSYSGKRIRVICSCTDTYHG